MIGKNAGANFNASAKGCAIIGEGKNIIQGIAQGDLNAAANNAGLLALYTVAAGGPVSNATVKLNTLAASQGQMAAKLGAAVTLNAAMSNSG